ATAGEDPNGCSTGYQRRPLVSNVAKCQRDPADSGSTPGLKLGWRAVIAALPASMVSASVTMMPATDSRILARRTFQPPRALDESRANGMQPMDPAAVSHEALSCGLSATV